MVTALRGFFASAAAVALLPLCVAAQQPAVITGHVTGEGGRPVANASVAITQLGLGSNTREDGTYTILVPAARATGQQTTLTVRAINYKPQTAQVTLSEGQITQDFTLAPNPLQLGEVVVTGAGTTSEVEKLGTVRNYVDSTAIVKSQEQNVVNALAAKAPNVTVISASGDPGASSSILIRGLTTIQGGDATGQPLFVVDGVPVTNSTDYSNLGQLGLNGGNTFPPNRLIDLNPDDIENVEILKGASSGAIYGSRAGQGVVLITTKHGRPGQTRYSLRSLWSLEQHTQLPALQRQFGLGTGGVGPSCVPGPASPAPDLANLNCRVGFTSAGSWGPAVAAGTPTFDHASDIFQDGFTTDNALNVSGGTERTQYFLSGAYNYNRGIVVGDNNHYRRISVRANGSQQIANSLKVGANIAYSSGSGGFVQSRNSTSGLLLGSWRTTPTFNNLPFLDPVFGLQRSYRFPNPGPGSEQASRSYDNPFFTANANPTSSDVARTFGGINLDWSPLSWLKFAENLGYDYSNDERFQSWAWSNSNSAPPNGVAGVGGVNAGYIRNTQVDNNLTATVSYSASSSFKGTVTVGQNLSSTTSQSRQTLGTGLITPQPFNLANTSTLLSPAYDFYQKIHLESYFGQATLDLWDKIFLQAALRNDGASTFGSESRHNWFPKGSASWLFYRGGQAGEGNRFLTYGKLRAAYGQSGTQPAPYLLTGNFVSQTINDGGWGPASATNIAGIGGLLTNFILTTPTLGPERVKEFEAGIDLGLWGDKADLSVTHYRQNTDDAILQIPVATSTGYFQLVKNAASLQNRGWEVTLNVRPVNARTFGWDVGLQWARNRGLTTALSPGLEFYQFPLSGGGNGAGLAVGGVAQPGVPIGAYRGTDFKRCGRGLTSDDGLDVDAQCGGAAAGTLYIGTLGFPELDLDNTYIVGDPNPDWTGSVRTNFRIGKLSLGGLLDVRSGGIAYNGTKGALQHFGVAQITADTRNAAPVQFGSQYYPINEDPTNPSHAVAGPGKDLPVALDESWWSGNASVFNGIDAAFLEPGHFVKLREVSVGYTFDQPWVGRSLGFSSIELRVSGRNLHSWNDYTGVDPETSLLGAVTPVRGLNYFNNPQARSWSFSLTLNR
jgi:TonB-linked SusC/RagA family outer membrane protein